MGDACDPCTTGATAGFTTPAENAIVASLILAPFAATGQCGEAVFGSCRRPRSGKTLICS